MRKDVFLIILLFTLIGFISYFFGGFESLSYENHSWVEIVTTMVNLISGKKQSDLEARNNKLYNEYLYTEKQNKLANIYNIGTVILPLLAFVILFFIVFKNNKNGKG